MTPNPDLAAQAAYAAGFRGNALVTAVAVAGAESDFGGNPGPSPTGDYGYWQINAAAHPAADTSRLLSDPLYNAQQAYAISNGGTNWAPWTTYRSGAWQQYVSAARAAIANLSNGVASAASTIANAVFPLGSAKYTISQKYGGPGGHPGVDLAAPAGTPIYAAEAGTIYSVGGDPSGFGNDYPVEVLPDGTRLTYGHAEKSYVTPGQRVSAGQIIALVGTEGDSSGPHLHFQVNAPNGATVDPLAWLQGQSATTQAGAGGQQFTAQLASAQFPGGNWDPLNWPGAAANAVTSDIGSGRPNFAGALFFLMLKGAAVITGGALIVVGVASTVKKDLPVPALPAPAGGSGAGAGAASSELPLAAAAA